MCAGCHCQRSRLPVSVQPTIGIVPVYHLRLSFTNGHKKSRQHGVAAGLVFKKDPLKIDADFGKGTAEFDIQNDILFIDIEFVIPITGGDKNRAG